MINKNRIIKMSQNYLLRFDQILNEMANQMLSQQVTNSITINFIRCMIPHHQAAIYMCENLLQYTSYPPLQEIATEIITMQTKGIEQMKEIEKSTRGFINSPVDVNHYINKYLQITKDMINKMRNAPRTININLNFINEMIPHHEGALAMCDNLLQYYIDPRLKKVAETILQEQSNGIKQLEQVKNNLCKKIYY